jgi:hypothetical protein
VVPIVMCGTLAKTRDLCHDIKAWQQKTWPSEVRFLLFYTVICCKDIRVLCRRARLSSSDENRQKNKHENEWISYSYSYSKTPWANNFMSEWNYAWQHICHLASYHPIMPLRPLFSWTVWLVAPGSPSKCTPCLRFSKVQSA